MGNLGEMGEWAGRQERARGKEYGIEEGKSLERSLCRRGTSRYPYFGEKMMM